MARLSDLKLQLDDSALSGRIAYDTGSSGMDFALTLDRIDLDRYQPPPTDPNAATEPIELPVDFLKPLRAKGTFTVGEIRIGGAQLTQLSAGIDVKDAVARFAPLKAQLYGGQYNGNIGIDMRPEVPRLTMDEHMSGHRHRETDEGIRRQRAARGQGQSRCEAGGQWPQWRCAAQDVSPAPSAPILSMAPWRASTSGMPSRRRSH